MSEYPCLSPITQKLCLWYVISLVWFGFSHSTKHSPGAASVLVPELQGGALPRCGPIEQRRTAHLAGDRSEGLSLTRVPGRGGRDHSGESLACACAASAWRRWPEACGRWAEVTARGWRLRGRSSPFSPLLRLGRLSAFSEPLPAARGRRPSGAMSGHAEVWPASFLLIFLRSGAGQPSAGGGGSGLRPFERRGESWGWRWQRLRRP